MALAMNARKQVAYIAESVPGTVPVAGTPSLLRFTDETLEYNVKYDNSKDIRADRQVTGAAIVDATVSGSINFELAYKEYDTMLSAALQGAWAVYGTAGKGAALALTLNSTAGTITAAVAPTGVDVLTSLVPGQYFRLTAPGDAADGAILRVGAAAPSTTVITVDTATPIPGTGTRAAVAGCIISSSRLVNGTTQPSFAFESQMLDVGQYFAYKGLALGKLDLNFAAGATVTGQLNFTGMGSVRNTVTNLPGVPTASQTFSQINAVTGFGTFLEGGTALTGTYIKDLKLALDNTLREQKAVGILGAAGVAAGHANLTGTMQVYLANGTLYDKFANGTVTSLSWRVSDSAGNGYAITIPNVRFTVGKKSGGGSDTDVMLDLTYGGYRDTTTGSTIIIDHFGA